jgi:L-amino acid N-acyltransferase YncA
LRDVRIREAIPSDAPAIARVHVDSWRTTYRGIVPDQTLADLSYEERERTWDRILSQENRDRGVFCYVAQDESGLIVGFVSGGPESTGDAVYKGEVYTIYLLQPYQGKGIGSRLMLAAARRLAKQGIRSMLAWVITDNSACRFYEAIGGEKAYERQELLRGNLIDEIAYGWKDTAVLSKQGETL